MIKMISKHKIINTADAYGNYLRTRSIIELFTMGRGDYVIKKV